MVAGRSLLQVSEGWVVTVPYPSIQFMTLFYDAGAGVVVYDAWDIVWISV